MKQRDQIHLHDAERAARDGLWRAAIGHCLAAETAGAARSEVLSTLQIALAEGRSVVGSLTRPADRADFLAIQAIALEDAAASDAVSAFAADNLSPLVAALEASSAGIGETDSYAIVSRSFDRMIATARLNELDETTARRRAAADILPRIDALVRGNPSDWEIRAKRFKLLLALERFGDAFNDLRDLAKVDRIPEILTAHSPPPLSDDPAGHLAHLAIKAITSRSATHVKALVDALADQPPDLMIAATDAVSDFRDDDKGLARVMIERARSRAQRLIAGEREKTALVRATEDVLPQLDDLAEANPSDIQILSMHYQLNLEAGHYTTAVEDLRHLMKSHADNPFVYVNLFSLLRTTDHPEVKTSLTHLMANIGNNQSELEPWFFSLCSSEAVPEAFQLLDRLIVHAPEFQMIRDLRDMADDIQQEPAHKFGAAPSGRHLIYASLVCWGGSYLKLMEEIAIASLLSPQNFPVLCASNDVVIDFVTMPEDAAKIMAMPGVQALAKMCEIRIYLFPPINEVCRPHIGRLSYNFLGSGSALTMKRAEQDGADLIFLIPDVVYADGSFAHVASLVTKQPCALMADGLNTFAQPMLEALEAHRDRAQGSLTVSIPDLIDYASQNLMPRTTDFYFDPDKPDVISYPQRVVFREQDGLVVHAFSKLAVYVSHAGYAPLGQVNYGTPDSFLTHHLMKNLPKQFIHPTDGDLKFLMMELAEDSGRLWPRTTDPLIDAIENMYRDYDFHINCFNLFEVGDRYPISVPYSDRLTTAVHREDFLASLWEARRTRTVFTELCTERAKYDRAVEALR